MLIWLGVRFVFLRKNGVLGSKALKFGIRLLMLNHIWNLFSKASSLWVAWTEANWLKGRSFWKVSIPASCSWNWKKILKLRDIAKSVIRFKVGNGFQVFLWLDHWHPAGYLLDTFGYRIVHDSGLSLHSKLDVIIKKMEIGFGLTLDQILLLRCRSSFMQLS